MNKETARARAMLVRGLENYDRYARNTYGRRDAINRDIPNAIEAMVAAKVAEALAPAADERPGMTNPVQLLPATEFIKP